MIRLPAMILATALLGPVASSAGQNLALREEGPSIKALSQLYRELRADTDFGALKSAKYDRASRRYEFTYRTPDGATQVAVYDAVTGTRLK
ncbi:MAG: hypothetical protein WCF16_08515 [Alphaproteobacteria bacterium]